MKADIVTIFPDFFRGPLEYGITRRAQEMGLAAIQDHDLREFAHDRHRTVDDRPFGGGDLLHLIPQVIHIGHLLRADFQDQVADVK